VRSVVDTAQVKSKCVLRSNSTARKSSDNTYGRSWVFEADGTAGPGGRPPTYASTESLSALDHRLPATAVVTAGAAVCSRTGTLKRRAKPVTPVVIVEMEGTGGRPTQLMTSFSRTPSPVGLSESSSQDSVSAAAMANPPIYECLEKLTEPSVYRSRLNTALSASIQEAIASGDGPPRSLSPRPPPAAEPVQYASLMEELQKTIGNRLSKHVESPEERWVENRPTSRYYTFILQSECSPQACSPPFFPLKSAVIQNLIIKHHSRISEIWYSDPVVSKLLNIILGTKDNNIYVYIIMCLYQKIYYGIFIWWYLRKKGR